jgi:hypothetical protein
VLNVDIISKFINFWFEFDASFNPGLVMMDGDGNVMTDQNGVPISQVRGPILNDMRIMNSRDPNSIPAIYIKNYDPQLRILDYATFKANIDDQNYHREIKSLSDRQLQRCQYQKPLGFSNRHVVRL